MTNREKIGSLGRVSDPTSVSLLSYNLHIQVKLPQIDGALSENEEEFVCLNAELSSVRASKQNLEAALITAHTPHPSWRAQFPP